MHGELFGKILEMSLLGSYSVVLVLAVRAILGRWERKYVYYLWLVVFLNFCLPFSFQGKYSLIPAAVADFSLSEDTLQEGAGEKGSVSAFPKERDQEPEKEREMHQKQEPAYAQGQMEALQMPDLEEAGDRNVTLREAAWRNGALPEYVWIAGILVILLCNLAGIFQTKRRIAKENWTAWSSKNRIAKVKGLPAPFLWGVFRPVIFLPSNLEEEEQRYIVAHENCHRRRKDPLVKVLAFLVVSIHWFNPFIWLAWALFCRDMEISCDEAVLAESGKNIKKQYAQSLLKYAAGQNGYRMLPLTFGEPSVKARIRNVLRFKKRNAAITAVVGICAVVVALGLLVRPGGEKGPEQEMPQGSMTDVANSESETETSPAEQPETDRTDSTAADSKTAGEADGEEQESTAVPAAHREGYREVSLTYADLGEFPFEKELLDESRREELAQRAMRELYDLTGYQIENAFYEYTEYGDFYFAKTKDDLKHSRTFYDRCYGGEEFGGAIPSIIIGSRRRVWFSDVDQMEVPDNIEERSNGELAVWFLQHSALYGGEEVANTELAYETEPELIRVNMTDGTYYEVQLDRQINSVYSIYGPYPVKEQNAALPGEYPKELIFSSGAGAWRTKLTLYQDGSFEGSYDDTNMGEQSEEYPNGTRYISRFAGKFANIRKIDDDTYALSIEESFVEGQLGAEYVEDGIRYVEAEPYGMERGVDFLFYTPQAPREGMNEEFLSWAPYREQQNSQLGFYGLYNIETGYGFFAAP